MLSFIGSDQTFIMVDVPNTFRMENISVEQLFGGGMGQPFSFLGR